MRSETVPDERRRTRDDSGGDRVARGRRRRSCGWLLVAEACGCASAAEAPRGRPRTDPSVATMPCGRPCLGSRMCAPVRRRDRRSSCHSRSATRSRSATNRHADIPAPTIDAATEACDNEQRHHVPASMRHGIVGTAAPPARTRTRSRTTRSTGNRVRQGRAGARCEVGVDEGELGTDDIVDEGGGHAPLIGSRPPPLDRSRRYCVYRRPSRDDPLGGRQVVLAVAILLLVGLAAAVAWHRCALRRAAREPELDPRREAGTSATAMASPSGSSAFSLRSTPSSSHSSRRLLELAAAGFYRTIGR